MLLPKRSPSPSYARYAPEGQKRKIEVEEALPIPMDEVLQTKRVLKF